MKRTSLLALSFLLALCAYAIPSQRMAHQTLTLTGSTVHQSDKPQKAGTYTGEKHLLLLLVEFADVSFAEGHDKAFYERIANERGLTLDRFRGSVSDYFSDQSNGRFQLHFDIAGPVRLSHNAAYYGANDADGNDLHAGEMTAEAVNALSDTDFAPYDWDGDGFADQVLILFAGQGEAASGNAQTVRPHTANLSDSDFGNTLETADGILVDTYACAQELLGKTTSEADGIGTICQELSHCFGLPYLHAPEGGFGMNCWDLMDSGCNNDDGFTPCGYTAYEKWIMGWTTPVTLSEPVSISHLSALSRGGESYVIYNESAPSEFFIIENRQQQGWDAALPRGGLMVMHIDYDAAAWASGQVNTVPDHPRYTILHADNSAGTTDDDLQGDPYPFASNDSLTNTSLPAFTLYHADAAGSLYLNRKIYQMVCHEDSTVSFSFDIDNNHAQTQPDDEEVMLHESFDNCAGTGGNDGKWKGNIASSAFKPDLDGWDCANRYGGKQCARFGKGACSITTPLFKVVYPVTATFRLAPWNTGTEKSVDFYLSETFLKYVELEAGHWTEISFEITESGTYYFGLLTSGRLFIDDFKLVRPKSSGIETIESTRRQRQGVYTLQGLYMGTDTQGLPKGIYIVGGKKRIVR